MLDLEPVLELAEGQLAGVDSLVKDSLAQDSTERVFECSDC